MQQTQYHALMNHGVPETYSVILAGSKALQPVMMIRLDDGIHLTC